MSTVLTNKIDANDKSIRNLLTHQKFFVDYFQREYRWEKEQMNQLIEDLTSTFLKEYKEGDEREKVEKYQNYYLGPVILSKIEGRSSVIDGQQRITSITLLLIYLKHLWINNLEEEKISGSDNVGGINELIYSEKFGKKSFTLSDPDRNECLTGLYENGTYNVKDTDDETISNMFERYQDIPEAFPDEIDVKALPYFIDWLTENVVVVEIIAHSDENAYTIFETMNDRGLNLSPTEMLKGYVLSKIKDKEKRSKLNNLWKKQIQKLNEYKKDEDMPFFQAWFRGKYAESMREGKVGSKDKDHELIGSRLHQWFKDNHENKFNLKTSDDFYNFFSDSFPFFVKNYLMIKDKMNNYDDDFSYLYYISIWGIADSLQDPLLLSPLIDTDDSKTVNEKINLVARFIETFTVRRSVNFRRFSHASIKYSMFKRRTLLIRNNDLKQLAMSFIDEIKDMDENWDKITDFKLHGQNKRFIKHLLSRISSFVDREIEANNDYSKYNGSKGNAFEIEHIWADKFERHKDEFDQISEFEEWRNSIGALILLPHRDNQSLKDHNYEKKLPHYLKQNAYAASLNEGFYENNPRFNNIKEKFKFKHHHEFKKKDISDRILLVKRICEEIWNVEYFNEKIEK